MNSYEKYCKNVKSALNHISLYYNSTPIISDFDYDNLYLEIVNFEKENPNKISLFNLPMFKEIVN